jgi:hypothetical protein
VLAVVYVRPIGVRNSEDEEEEEECSSPAQRART